MVAAGDQQEETIPRRAPADLKLSCLPFWTFVYQEAAGTHWALAQLYELCHQWLRPEVHSQEQMLELLVLEQFLSILAYKVLLSVEVQHHESCKKAVSLVEDLTKALEEPGVTRDAVEFSRGVIHSLEQGVCGKHAAPLPSAIARRAGESQQRPRSQ
uniref:SCAN box domain-containing protein n=1 Tax=Equus caballus TaxID=9796 RepID=A0A9L0T657_HORSE